MYRQPVVTQPTGTYVQIQSPVYGGERPLVLSGSQGFATVQPQGLVDLEPRGVQQYRPRGQVFLSQAPRGYAEAQVFGSDQGQSGSVEGQSVVYGSVQGQRGPEYGAVQGFVGAVSLSECRV